MLIYENKEKKMPKNAGPWKLDCSFRNYFTKLWYILILQSDSNKWCRKGRFGYNWRRFQFKGAIWRYTVWVLEEKMKCETITSVLFFRIFFVHRVYFVMKIEYMSFLITFEFCRVFQKSMHPMSLCMIRQLEFCRKPPYRASIIKWLGLPTTFRPLETPRLE